MAPYGFVLYHGVWIDPDSLPKKGAERNIGDYRTWKDWKLLRELEQRGLPLPDPQTKGNMAKVLRKHDEDEEVFGPGPLSNLTTPANSPSKTGKDKAPVLSKPKSIPTVPTATDVPPARAPEQDIIDGNDSDTELETAGGGSSISGARRRLGRPSLAGPTTATAITGIENVPNVDYDEEVDGLIIPVISDDEFV
ncbi:hypothetical protein CLAFUW4_10859 [Fulvia fulva]|uniref:Uncharacterized protein n=1 Tax=Passalora fulva TaxID=5499 RepID=A0A9Q8URH6_PASFU|nr:uncharacterized protein CLAFUR5_09901 [Fulvia fulva]KAK4619391.1 hypothetical protein CLAFUR4_10864 [Fulvia fulva]KAK4620345.1 hypothetical protein CLAFUR0_10871 [Fulvia fulva]UJO19735.1 hypothetical protein CLAFUR5_09901 [Fulvia fulva]WPV17698.1 hypothetical protein CLAFUW4_10859 [Fulvia fulva]WPV31953.1 hypothetical protein CLAFUW7_10857 [Fulvia fulva]